MGTSTGPTVRAVTDAEQSWEESVFWLHAVAAECQSPSRRMELNEFRENLETGLNC